jgi:hypothetical protein
MDDLVGLARYPILLGIFIFLALWLLTWFSARRFADLRRWLNEEHPVYDAVQGATLTLLALLIGFTFSMALNRYDQRKDLEEEEANAIGTEYLRVDFLPAVGAAKARELLVLYIDQRVLFYATRGEDELAQVDQRTAELQRDLWDVVRNAAAEQPNPVMAEVVTGMNDVLNSQGYTLAAWRNRIPEEAWWLMIAIAVCASMSVGVGLHRPESSGSLLPVLPLVISLALFLTADIDSPRRGMIRLVPQNLLALSASLRPH